MIPKSSRTPLPSGLPKRFSDGQPGYERLQKFLEIPNAKTVEAVLSTVKESLPRGLGKLLGAERRRVALTAYYDNPEPRRKLWRQRWPPATRPACVDSGCLHSSSSPCSGTTPDSATGRLTTPPSIRRFVTSRMPSSQSPTRGLAAPGACGMARAVSRHLRVG